MSPTPEQPSVTPADLRHIVYRSEAVLPVTTSTLEALLTVSRGHNRQWGITGLLLSSRNRFLQCIEGPRAVVGQLYDRIGQDPRHRDVITLLDEPVASRSFTRWDMACSIISSSWWMDLTRAEWGSHPPDVPVVASRGLMLMKSAWYAFGEGFEGSLH